MVRAATPWHTTKGLSQPLPASVLVLSLGQRPESL